MRREVGKFRNMVVRGHVKWFDTTKGYGFVVSADGEGDILLHSNVLRVFGFTSVAEGAEIVLRVQVTERGRQAVEVSTSCRRRADDRPGPDRAAGDRGGGPARAGAGEVVRPGQGLRLRQHLRPPRGRLPAHGDAAPVRLRRGGGRRRAGGAGDGRAARADGLRGPQLGLRAQDAHVERCA